MPILRLLVALLLLGRVAPAASPRIVKIDPPNWYANLPKPMLLLHGEALTGATFTLSDPALHIDSATISENGHWAQLWLSASPAAPETIQLRATVGSAHTEAPYTFAPRRAAADGMAGFSPQDVVYLILTDRFADGDLSNDGPDAHSTANSPEAIAERAKPKGWHGGDLRGVADHLSYLQSFGTTAVWLTPVYQNHGPEAYHGYHTTDYYAVDPHFGTLADLQSLAAALHAHGMKLILDTVPNHVGPFHPWIQDEPAPDWFHGTLAHHIAAEYNFNALIDPHAPERDRLATLHGWFVDLLPDMNTDSPTVSTYLRQNVIWWIEQTGADGLRYDTFPYVNREFWHDLNFTLRTLYPHLTEVGEVSDPRPEITSAFADGVTLAGVDTGLYTPFDFPLYHGTRDVFANGQPMSHLRDILREDVLYPHPERLMPFLGNHDESRFAQSVPDLATQQLAYTFLLTTRGTPQLYSGDEIAMPGGNDPDDRRDFPGGFPGTASAAFNPLDNAFTPSGRSPEQSALLSWITTLTTLRRTYPALACGSEQVLAADADTLVYARVGGSACPSLTAPAQPVIVALHRGTPAHLRVDLAHTDVTGCTPKSLLPSASTAKLTTDLLELDLGNEVAILACR